MSITYHERPGVYSDYEASSLLASGGGAKVIALAGVSSATAGLYTVTSLAGGLAVFGEDSELGKMLAAACQNGAGTVLCYSMTAESSTAYAAAFAAVLAEKAAACFAIASDDLAIQQALRDAIVGASAQKGECIGICAMSDPTKAELLARAAAIDSERMVLVGPDVYLSGAETLAGGYPAAAALAGAIAAMSDPALPLNGTVLCGFGGVSAAYCDTDLDALIRGGVTVLECGSGKVSVIRGITTKKTVGDGCDATYRELNTMLVIDDVIPGIRNALAATFARAKNNAATRSAIRAQVVVELESRLRREIIDSYENVAVEASSTDAGTCEVSFRFAVTRGLNRICLTAHITV